MLDDFMIRTALAGIGIALAAGPIGCFVAWRRMAYFGDATAHASVLGVALSLAFGISVFVGAMAMALVMAVIITGFSQRNLATDTMLGVMAHSALAAGLVAVSFIQGIRIDLMAYLFGDILAVSKTDLGLIWAGALISTGLILWRWNRMLTATLSPDLAYTSGINPKHEQLIFTLALALIVAVAIKLVGALLIGALLIIPAASARNFSQTPERMAQIAIVIGVASVLIGLQASNTLDTPTGPSIVCAAAAMFLLSAVTRPIWPGLLAVAIAALPVKSDAEDITVFAAASIADAVQQVAQSWPDADQHSITIAPAGSSTLARQIDLGAPADIFISANVDWMDWLATRNAIQTQSRVDLAGNRLVLITNVMTPDLTQDKLATALNAQTLAMAMTHAVPAGMYGKAALQHLGQWNAVAPFVVETDNVRAALALVALGEAPVGVVYASDAQADPRVTLAYVFPPESHPRITYPAALTRHATPAAQGLLTHLANPTTDAIWIEKGFTRDR